MNIPSHLARLLVSVVDAGSAAAAARNNGVSQSSVLAALQRLEDELGVSVFRRGRALQLTDAGELLLVEARRLTGDLEEIERLLSRAGAEPSSHISMVLQPDLDAASYAQLVSGFLETVPDSRIDLILAPSPSAALSTLVQGGADTAFVSAMSVPHQLESIAVGSVRLVLVAPRSWTHLAGMPGLQQFGGFPFIEGRHTAALDWGLSALRRAGASPRTIMSNVPLALLCQLVVAGVGAAMVPHVVADSLVQSGAQLIPDVPTLDVPVHLVRRAGLPHPLVDALFETARSLRSSRST